jgi:hypothetical protein
LSLLASHTESAILYMYFSCMDSTRLLEADVAGSESKSCSMGFFLFFVFRLENAACVVCTVLLHRPDRMLRENGFESFA